MTTLYYGSDDQVVGIGHESIMLLSTLTETKHRQVFLRPEHSKVENAVEIVKANQTSFRQTCDTAWILLCRLSWNVLPFPECSDIAGWRVPFWTGFNRLLAKEDQEGAYTSVAYPPVIDAKPSGMSTIFTAKNKSK